MGPWHALFLSYQGHFLLQPRLVALVVTPFGIAPAPLLYNVLGLLFQIAPVLFLLSARFQSVIPSLRMRLLLGAIYLLMPSTEVNVTIASAQFHLVVLATMVLVASPPNRWYWHAFDVASVALCALTGAFVYVLFPVAILWWWLRRQRSTGILAPILGLGVLAQIYALTLAPRSQFGLGASVHDFLLIFSDRIIITGSLAEEGHTHVFLTGFPHGTIIAALVCVISFGLVAFAAARAPWELRIFAVAGFGIAVAGLAVPLVSAAGNQWDIILSGRAAGRYFLMAQIAWVVLMIWAACQVPRAWQSRTLVVLILGAFASGLIADWSYPALADDHWPQEAKVIVTAPPGTHLTLPIPPLAPWSVDITTR
jgi:hypothetical protein